MKAEIERASARPWSSHGSSTFTLEGQLRALDRGPTARSRRAASTAPRPDPTALDELGQPGSPRSTPASPRCRPSWPTSSPSSATRSTPSTPGRPPTASTTRRVGELRDGQVRLANEQARYQIAFREDLARLAEQLKRPR